MILSNWGAATDTGRVRTANEDAYLADPPIFVVADGMGGHAAGDVASALAIEVFSRLVGDDPLNANDSVNAISTANLSILARSEGHPELTGMGTTVAGLAVVSLGGAEHWQIFNVGDSRVYRLVDGQLSQLTVDHSEAEEMVLAGRLTRDEARSYTRNNVVTRSLGTSPPPQSDSWVFPPATAERFLICSDGLTLELKDEQIRRVLIDEADASAAADMLVTMAVDAGGHDNVTAIVVDGLPPLVNRVEEDTTPRPGHDG